MKRRVRVLPPGYLVGTKGHSVLKKKTYLRKPLIEVEEFSSHKMPTSRRHEFDSGYQMGSFHDARAFSNAVMDDSYDLQAQSRGRDHRLLSQMNNALVSTDFRRPPKAAVAALRASRTPVLASRPLSLRATHHPKSKEALLVGDDKLDILERPRSRKPRTRYYADKLQKMEDKEQLSSIMATPPTSKLRASKPPKPIPTYTWRAIRDVDGYTKPANIMSWQYRLESRVEPDDLIHKPSTYGKMRDQVRGVQDKLDRHRQLLDRYRETKLAAAHEVDPFVHKKSADLGERIALHADRVVADTGYGDSYGAGGHISAGRTARYKKRGVL